MANTDQKTNGRRKALIEALERRVRDAIDVSYLTGERRENGSRVTVPYDDPRSVLRDYVRNHSMLDKFDDLIDRETSHERRHRRSAPAGWRFKFGAKQGALIVMLNNIGDGARLEQAPDAVSFISMRDTAAEAVLIGWLARVALQADPGLLEALELLDYAAAGRNEGE